jgi:hypothetical protein
MLLLLLFGFQIAHIYSIITLLSLVCKSNGLCYTNARNGRNFAAITNHLTKQPGHAVTLTDTLSITVERRTNFLIESFISHTIGDDVRGVENFVFDQFAKELNVGQIVEWTTIGWRR